MSKYGGHIGVLSVDLAGGSSYTEVAQVVDVAGPGISRAEIEVTARDSTEYWKEFIKGLKDGGEVTFGLRFDQAVASHGSTTGLLSDFNNETAIPSWRFVVTGSGTAQWSGFLTGFNETNPLEGSRDAEVTVKATGKPVYA